MICRINRLNFLHIQEREEGGGLFTRYLLPSFFPSISKVATFLFIHPPFSFLYAHVNFGFFLNSPQCSLCQAPVFSISIWSSLQPLVTFFTGYYFYYSSSETVAFWEGEKPGFAFSLFRPTAYLYFDEYYDTKTKDAQHHH